METPALPRYQSHKCVHALKIEHVTLLPGDDQDYPVAHVFFEDKSYPPIHVNLFGKPTPHGGWYYVIYDAVGDVPPYESFSPPQAFETGYKPITRFEPQGARGIGWAIKELQHGSKVRRAGWNGKGMWLQMQVPDAHSKMTLPYVYIEYPFSHLAYPNGSRVPWLPSQTDLLAIDWEISE